MSRCTKAKGLYIVGEIDFESLTNGKVSKNVSEEIKRLETVPIQFELNFLYEQPENSVKIIFKNVQSLHKHFEDLKNDYSYTVADVIICIETWTKASDKFEIANYQAINHSTEEYKKARGHVCFIKKNFKYKVTQIKCNNLEEDQCEIGSLTLEDYTIIYTYKPVAMTKTDFIEKLKKFILSNNIEKKIILFGDFNLNMKLNENRKFLEKELNKFDLTPVFPKDLSTTDCNTQIDGLFINFVENNFN